MAIRRAVECTARPKATGAFVGRDGEDQRDGLCPKTEQGEGQILEDPEISYASVSEVKVEAPEEQVPVDVDGEFVGFAPLKVKLVPMALRFVVG